MRAFRLAVVVVLTGAIHSGPALADSEESRLRELLVSFSGYYDPSGADFRNLHFRNLKWPSWCGEINAKNRLGGFTGWRTFAASDQRYAGARDQRAQVKFFEGAAADRECRVTRNHWERDWDWQ
jgi:hypothetical protein